MYQNRVELEQRDCQNRIDAEGREREFELHCEELAVQCKENCAQHQPINVMTMAIINRNNELKNNSTPNDGPMNK
jgi:hypothetical protein